MKKIKHWIYRIVVLLAILGIPFFLLGGENIFTINPADAVSSATSYTFDADDLSGEYVVLINNTLHEKKGTIPVWVEFFSGRDVPVILDDIHCLVADSDTAGREFAEICQARLPENQMKIKIENGLLLVSKAEYSRFDIIIMSKELAEAYSAYSIGENADITLVEVQ